MIVLVCGGRDFDNKTLLESVLNGIDQERKIVGLVHGCARGADTLARDWMAAKIKEERAVCLLRRAGAPREYRVPWLQYHCERWIAGYPANWDKYKKAAGAIRNSLMLEIHKNISLVVAFPGGKGTLDMIKKATAKGIEVRRIEA